MKRLSAIIFLFFLVIIFFWKAAILKGVFFAGDIILFNYPLRHYGFGLLKKGIIPLWTPHIFGGFPLLAESQAGIFYPLNILMFTLLPSYVAYNYSVILHFFLAGLFTYLYCRVIKLDPWSSLVAGIIFTFNGFFITHLVYMNSLNTYIWLPLIFLLIELIIKRKGFIYIVFLGALFGIQCLAGYFPTAAHTLFVSVIYITFRALWLFRKDKEIKQVYRLYRSFAIAVIIGMGLFAIQLLPTYELLRLSTRFPRVSYNFWTVASFPLKHFITLILPNFFGNPFNDTYISACNYVDLCCYVGILPLILSLLAIVYRRDIFTFLFTTLAILALTLALGRYNPLYRLLYYLPIINLCRLPSRYLFFYVFSISILSGLGFNYLSASFKEKSHIIKKISLNKLLGLIAVISLIIIFSLFLKFYNYNQSLLSSINSENPALPQYNYLISKISRLYSTRINDLLFFALMFLCCTTSIAYYIKNKLGQSGFCFIAVCIILINLFAFGIRYNPLIDPKFLFEKPQSVNFLEKDKDIYRICSRRTKEIILSLERSIITNLQPFPELIKPYKEIVGRNIGLIYKVSSIDGYASLYLKRYSDIYEILNPKLFNLLNIKYILFPSNVNVIYDKDGQFEEVFRNDFVKIYKNKRCLPRAHLVYKAKIIKDEKKILQELKGEDFNPYESVILEDYIKPQAPEKEINLHKVHKARVQIVKYTPKEVVIKAELIKEGFLVLSDVYYPGWKVFVDGKKERIYRADYIIRAVRLNKGLHIVRFIYDPSSFKIGAYITLSTLLLLIIILIYNIRRIRKDKHIKINKEAL